MIIPTIGRIVLYCLSQFDAEAINKQRANAGTVANAASAGDVLPAMVVKVFSEDCINIKVMLDGPDHYWATSRSVSEEPVQGRFHWMPYQKQVAAPAPMS